MPPHLNLASLIMSFKGYIGNSYLVTSYQVRLSISIKFQNFAWSTFSYMVTKVNQVTKKSIKSIKSPKSTKSPQKSIQKLEWNQVICWYSSDVLLNYIMSKTAFKKNPKGALLSVAASSSCPYTFPKFKSVFLISSQSTSQIWLEWCPHKKWQLLQTISKGATLGKVIMNNLNIYTKTTHIIMNALA